MATTLQTQANLIEIAQLLGLTNWQLSEGNYNGVSFHTLQPFSAAISQSDVANLLNTGAYAYNKILGQNIFGGDLNVDGQNVLGANSNSRSNLFITTLGLMNVNDTISLKHVRKRLPYSDQDNIEPMGLGGWSFNINALFFGPDYLTALDNFLLAWAAPDPQVANTLIHPVYGEILGDVYLVNVKLRYSSDGFQSVMIELQFEAEQSLAWLPTPLSVTQIASRALLAVLEGVAAVGSAIQLKDFISA